MQNTAFLENTSFSSRNPCSSIENSHTSTRHKHVGYVKGDILLDIIKEGLIEKRKIIKFLEFSDEKSNEETWNFGKALCRKVSQKLKEC